MRHDGWFAPLVLIPGKAVPDPIDTAGHVVRHRRDGCIVIVDVIGPGSGVVSHLRINNEIEAVSFNGAKAATARSKDRMRKFRNWRAQAYMQLAEALDPNEPGGSPIALPPGPEIIADLCCVTYTDDGVHGVTLKSKEELKKEIHRSPDVGDAIAMCWAMGQAAIYQGQGRSPEASRAIASLQRQTVNPGRPERSRFYDHHGGYRSRTDSPSFGPSSEPGLDPPRTPRRPRHDDPYGD